MMRTSTLRPGLMVHVGTSLKGNTSYRTRDLGTETATDAEGRCVEISKWDTERTVLDKAEQERAVKARSLVRSKVQCVCIQSNAFGLSCLEKDEAKLYAAITEAEAIAADFNRTASVTELSVFIQVGRVAADDERAVANINREMRGLIETMAEGMKNLDKEAIRDAANRARALGGMLTDNARAEVQAAIDVARKAARQIVEAGEEGAGEVDRAAIRKVLEARTGFLDLDDEGSEVAPVQPAARPVDVEVPVEYTPEGQAAMFTPRTIDLD